MGTLFSGVLPGATAFFDEDRLFLWIGILFGGSYSVSMVILIIFMKPERETQTKVDFIPSLRRIFRNPAFTPLVKAWMLDYIAAGTIGTMIKFFIKCKENCSPVLTTPTKGSFSAAGGHALEKNTTVTVVTMMTTWLWRSADSGNGSDSGQ